MNFAIIEKNREFGEAGVFETRTGLFLRDRMD